MFKSTSRAIVAPGFGVFENRNSKQPVFVAAGLDSSYCFRQAAAYARSHNLHEQTGKAVVRRAASTITFFESVEFSNRSEFDRY